MFTRHRGLKSLLQSRRSELVHELQHRIRAARNDGVTDRDVVDDAESTEAHVQDDIGFALIQLTTETLNKIDTALRRLEEGSYGDCFECGGEISEARLRALAFALRCRDCEAVREASDRRERSLADHDSSALFVDSSG